MIDLGKIPRAIFSAVEDECTILEKNISEISESFWPDWASGVWLDTWEKTLQIVVPTGATVAYRRLVIISRLNALGGMHVRFFYELAERFGWRKDISPEILITDGSYLPFRVGISRVDVDKVYDDVKYGATTIDVSFETQGHELDAALESLFLRFRSLGTVMIFEVV